MISTDTLPESRRDESTIARQLQCRETTQRAQSPEGTSDSSRHSETTADALKEKRRIYRQRFNARHPGYAAQKSREWRLRNPEKSLESRRKWQAKNPEKFYQHRERSHQTVINKKRAASILNRANGVLSYRRKSIEKEIRHHMDRGRDAAAIVAWLNIPLSAILPIMEQIKSKTASANL